MTGGLISIVSYGNKDLYLTGAPQITLFKVVYRRYTNFSIESFKIDFGNTLDFGGDIEHPFPRYGDLLSKSYLEILIPEVHIKKKDLDISPTNFIGDTSAKTDYDNVVTFMKLNAKAYRKTLEIYNAENLNNVGQMLQEISEVFSAEADISDITTSTVTDVIQNYITAVKKFREDLLVDYFEGTLKNTDGTLIMDIAETNISTIVDILKAKYSLNYASVTKEMVMNATQRCITNSKKYQDFFFKRYNKYLKEREEKTSQYLKFAWVKKLGHAIIDYIDIYIGGEKIDRHYGQWLDIWHELTTPDGTESIYNKMIGNVSSMTTFDANKKPAYKLVIPLQFWFCRNIGLAFPLIAMQYNDISIKIKLKSIDNCAYIENTGADFVNISDIWQDKGYFLTCNLMCDYIYLDSLERKKFAQSGHEYLIDTVQTMPKVENITQSTTQAILEFEHPCKELIWVAQKDEYINNNNGFKMSLWGNYSLTGENSDYLTDTDKFKRYMSQTTFNTGKGRGNPITNVELDILQYRRFDKRVSLGDYFNRVQPYKHHRRSPCDGINIYSFSLLPEEHQPSSTCNFSRIAKAQFTIKINPEMFKYQYSDIYPEITAGSDGDFKSIGKPTTNVTISIYALSYNVLRINGGYGALAFTF